MKNEKIIERLNAAYQNPDQKFCFFTGQNNTKVAEALGVKQWDWTPQPTANIEPYYWNTHTIPLAFGCKPIFTSEGKEWLEHLIKDASQVRDIKVPDVYEGRTGEILEIASKIKEELPEDTLIRLPDIQSPLGVCELMWDDSFYMALITHPDEIRALLDKITEFIIQYVNAFKNILGDQYNPSCHPQVWSDPSGYYISDDVNSMVSPEMHASLCVDYINRITEACGPLFYHSCTFTDPYIENMKKVKDKKLINWSVGTSMDPARIIKIFSGETFLAPHIGKNCYQEETFLNMEQTFKCEVDVIRYFLDSMRENTTMNIVLHEGLLEDVELTKEIYYLFKEYGYIPEDYG